MYNKLYSTSNEFVKRLKASKNYSFLMNRWNGSRGPKSRLSLEKVIVLNLFRFFIHTKDLKAFHRNIKITDMIPESFPNECNRQFSRIFQS